MKIFDCFMFYDEKILLEIRLNILNEFIGDSRSPKDGGKWKYGTFLANGWYWAGNEPDLLAPWLFPFAGAQYLTAYWTRYLVNNVYTANGKSGLPGNDDYGTMSSWLIWGLIGFYPMAGTEQYIVGSPSFNNITINRKEEGGLMFHTATTWSSITSSILKCHIKICHFISYNFWVNFIDYYIFFC